MVSFFLGVPAKPLSMFVGQMILTQGLRLMDLGCGAMLEMFPTHFVKGKVRICKETAQSIQTQM